MCIISIKKKRGVFNLLSHQGCTNHDNDNKKIKGKKFLENKKIVTANIDIRLQHGKS